MPAYSELAITKALIALLQLRLWWYFHYNPLLLSDCNSKAKIAFRMKPGTKDCITEANFGKLKSGLKKKKGLFHRSPLQICSTNREMCPEAKPSLPQTRLTASVTGCRAKEACPSPVRAWTEMAEMLLTAWRAFLSSHTIPGKLLRSQPSQASSPQILIQKI